MFLLFPQSLAGGQIDSPEMRSSIPNLDEDASSIVFTTCSSHFYGGFFVNAQTQLCKTLHATGSFIVQASRI